MIGFIPGFLISWLTFPGVIIHEAAHLLFCRMFRLAVFDVCYFRKNGDGYVIHEKTENFTAVFFVSLGPFIINSALCVLFCMAAFLPVWELNIQDPLGYLFAWLGLSMGMHAIPSRQDLKNIWQVAPNKAKEGNVLAILSYPLVGFLFVMDLGRMVWADLAYGIAIGFLGPLAIFKALS